MFELLGALVPTFLVSRITLWLCRRAFLLTGLPAIFVAHGLSAAVCVTLGAAGAADGGPMAWEAGLLYLVPQAAWLLFDCARFALRRNI